MLLPEQAHVIAEIEAHQITPKLLRRMDNTLTDEVLADAIIDEDVTGVKADYLREALPANCIANRRMERAIDRMSVQIQELVQVLGALVHAMHAQPLPALPPVPPHRLADGTPPQRRG